MTTARREPFRGPVVPARTNVGIRWLIQRDYPEVLEVEAGAAKPWCEADYKAYLRQKNCIAMVAEWGEKIVGVVAYKLHPRKIEVGRIIVHQDFRREKIATQIAEKLKGKVAVGARSSFFLDVPETSLDLQCFLRSCELKAMPPFPGDDVYRFVWRKIDG